MKGYLLPIVVIILLNTGCSTMGSVAKASFISAKEIYTAQPESVKDGYPFYMKKIFFTSELLTTSYDEWKMRIVSRKNIDDYIYSNKILVKLEYELDFESFHQDVMLVHFHSNVLEVNDEKLWFYEFSFDKTGKIFWQQYNKHLFDMDKPWFTYPVSPQLPLQIKRNIKEIQYNYAPTWGYLTLREFMELFDLNTDKRWNDFCVWRNYGYDDSSVCGSISVDDSLESISMSEG